MGRRYIRDHIQEMISMREEGKTLDEISKRTGFGVPRISEALTRAGYGKRYRGTALELPEVIYMAEQREPVLQKIIINGKRYVDVTQLFGS